MTIIMIISGEYKEECGTCALIAEGSTMPYSDNTCPQVMMMMNIIIIIMLIMATATIIMVIIAAATATAVVSVANPPPPLTGIISERPSKKDSK